MVRRGFGLAVALCMPMLLQGCADGNGSLPGTPTRGILTAQEAAPYTPENYFARGGLLADPDGPWHPQVINLTSVSTPWRVGPHETWQTVQQAVNAAIRKATERSRIYISVQPGVYQGAVYIPEDAPPITLFGAGQQPQDVRLELALDSQFSPARYRQTVNPAGQFRDSDPAWYLYSHCATKSSALIGTNCAAVVWSQSNDFQIARLSIVNSLLDTVNGGTHQGVALRTDGDRVQLDNVRLIGRQDTVYLNTSNRENLAVTDRISRVLVKDSYIEGDVDYVFGRASVVFDGVEFHTVSTRGSREAYVLAPNTLPDQPYGFLVLNSRFTGDAGYQGSVKAKLGRAWDQGAGKTGYLPGNTANGQALIAQSTIDASYDRLSPWGWAATTARPYRANSAADRNLNDTAWNRLWEWQTAWR